MGYCADSACTMGFEFLDHLQDIEQEAFARLRETTEAARVFPELKDEETKCRSAWCAAVDDVEASMSAMTPDVRRSYWVTHCGIDGDMYDKDRAEWADPK